MADRLDKMIADKRREVDAARHTLREAQTALQVAEAQLAAFEEAARLRPVNAEDRPRRGRQPGAISADWRRVLHRIFQRGAVSYATIHQIAVACGIDTDIGNVRDRVRAFIRSGLMEGSVEDGFEVTDDAASRFGFSSDLPDEPEDEDDEMWTQFSSGRDDDDPGAELDADFKRRVELDRD